MALSGSTNFTLDRDTIITDALIITGVLAEGETPSANQITSVGRTLNMIAKAWQSHGLNLWKRTTAQLTGLSAGTSSYVVGTGGTNGITERPYEILKAWRRQDPTGTPVDIPIRIVSRDEYDSLPDKSQSGTIILIYYDRQRDSGTVTSTSKIYVWHTHETSSTDQLWLTYVRPIQDFDAATDEPDFPQDAYLALTYAVALGICPKYGINDSDFKKILSLATLYYEQWRLGDNESTSIYIFPSKSYGE